jgi:2-(3-amino-3-carboxypropyl)histidine synthase
MDFDLELERAVSEISKNKAKRVLLQLPDGLKPKADEIQRILEQKTKAEILIWEGSCFGSCDIPNTGSVKIDLLIQWGHSK